MDYLLGKVINYNPISDNGENYITKNIDRITHNNSGFIGYCNRIIDNSTIEILYKKSRLEGSIDGVKSVYGVKPSFIFGERIESLNGTIRQGYIIQLLWHGKDEEFKYIIEDLKGKKISRQY
jgi:hypothetical protein